MKIAIDVSPLSRGNFLAHRVRGTGSYVTNLLKSLRIYCPDNEYIEFSGEEELPKDADVVHYPYFEPFFFTLPSRIGKNSLVTVHDLTPLVFPDKFPAGLKGNFRWRIQKRRLRNAGAVITDSQCSKNDIAKFTKIDPSKIYSIYLAAPDNFKPQTEAKKKAVTQKYNLPDKFALYVGDATWNKNLPLLVASFSELGIPLAIAGKAFSNYDYDKSNPWNRDLEKAQNLAQSNKNIYALGFVPDDDLAPLYGAATIFAMPSLYEGFGLPLLEAMQSGCPVVTSERGSLKEVGGESVYYVDPESLDSMKDGITKLWKDEKLRQELSGKGVKRAKDFSWKKTAEQTVKVYEKISGR